VQDDEAALARPVLDRLQQPGLAHARLALEDDQPRAAGNRVGQCAVEDAKRLVAPDQQLAGHSSPHGLPRRTLNR
jgi:hypothetical protein